VRVNHRRLDVGVAHDAFTSVNENA
jgi:hypothetical protein